MNKKEELKYYDVLYDFASVVVRLNEQAFDGETKKNIEKKICRLIPAFTTLCGMDADDLARMQQANEALQQTCAAYGLPFFAVDQNYLQERRAVLQYILQNI